ncbi:MAG: DUF3089 domain-containing protein [Solirubrobacteraceae bacterium]|jgi:hypothetical protein
MPSQKMFRLIRSGMAAWVFAVSIVVASFAAAPAGASAEEAGPNKPVIHWLCNPQTQSAVEDPCLESRAATVVSYSGNTRKETIEPEVPSDGTPVDCFYVYPTVNDREGPNAKTEKSGPEEELVAREQASRFSQVCKVYAPLYPQVTLLAKPATVHEAEIAYQGVKAAFETYMAHYNGGRGFVLIGHSQGAAVLKAIIHKLIEEEHKAWLHQLVSAIILGGAVEVEAGEPANGSFDEVPACSTEAEAGCVIAYSSYYTESPPEPAPSSIFTRTIWPGREVLCVNPTLTQQAKTSKGPLYPYAPTTTMNGQAASGQPAPKASTPWIAEPGLATAQCRRYDWATWLQVKLASMSAPVEAERKADNELPKEEEYEGENWGLHRYDVNEALGNLVGTVEAEGKTYLAGK